MAHFQVFGGCGGPPTVGQWTEPVAAIWYFLINVARCCNYTYQFEFSEDWRQADIKIKCNCCCCLPPCCCIPPWFQAPDWCAKFDMVQADASTDGARPVADRMKPFAHRPRQQRLLRFVAGSHWIRRSSICGKPLTKSYDLVEAFKPDGSPGRFHDRLATMAPAVMLVSR